MRVIDLGSMPYLQAWALQEEYHAQVLAGAEEALLLVEHPPVITLGRREGSLANLITAPGELPRHGIDLVHSDRGGDITYHAPGQLVAYPIIRLSDHGFSVSGYVHLLEALAVQTLDQYGIVGETDPAAVGVWVRQGQSSAKICAIGVRVRRGVTLHGLALNVEVDLAGFSHIIPCGLAGRAVTSLAALLGEASPSMAQVKQSLTAKFLSTFATLAGRSPSAKAS